MLDLSTPPAMLLPHLYVSVERIFTRCHYIACAVQELTRIALCRKRPLNLIFKDSANSYNLCGAISLTFV